jgi:hypothetical protein
MTSYDSVTASDELDRRIAMWSRPPRRGVVDIAFAIIFGVIILFGVGDAIHITSVIDNQHKLTNQNQRLLCVQLEDTNRIAALLGHPSTVVIPAGCDSTPAKS